MNVGIIMFCKKLNFLDVVYHLDDHKIKSFFQDADLECIEDSLEALHRISRATSDGGPIARLDTASRFRWLTATRSTILQSSKVHPGLTTNPVDTLRKLFEQLVL